MSLILTPNTVMSELIFVIQNQRVECVFHNRCAGAPTAADLLAIENVWKSWWWNTTTSIGGRQMFSANCVFSQLDITSIHTPSGIMRQYTPTANQTGSIAATTLPSYVAAVCKWTTGFSGRSYRGRTYWPGVPHGQIDSVTGRITNAQIAIYNTWCGNLMSYFNTASYPLVVASKYSGVTISPEGYRRAIPRPSGITTLITGFNVDNATGTRRSRKVNTV